MRFLRIGLLIIFINLTFFVFAGVPQWQWAKKGNCASFDYANCVTTDSSGNVSVGGGFFAVDMIFDSVILSDNGGLNSNLFIAKYNDNGNLLWAKSPFGVAGPSALGSDKYNNTYMSGLFGGVLDFDSLHSIYGQGGYDCFIAKYDTSGNVQWAKDIGGTSTDEKISFNCDAEGNTSIVCFSNSTTLSIDTITLSNPFYLGAVAARLNINGNVMWAKQLSYYLNPVGIASDAKGNVYITGTSSEYNFYVGPFLISNASTAPAQDMFLIKLDPNGNVMWVKTAGTGLDNPTAITCDKTGNIIITGYFVLNHLLGPFMLQNANSLMNTDDFFVVKYNSNGNIVWATSNGGKGEENTSTITCDPDGNIFVGGVYLNDSVIVGPWITFDQIKPFDLAGDIFVVKYDKDGNPLGFRNAGGNKNDRLFSITIDNNDNLYLAGQFESNSIDFGGNILNRTGNFMDMFLAKTTNIVGINELTESKNRLNVYPNPFDKELYLRYTEESGIVSVIDIAGKLILREPADSYLTQINTDELKPGFYLLSYQDNTRNESYKLVKF